MTHTEGSKLFLKNSKRNRQSICWIKLFLKRERLKKVFCNLLRVLNRVSWLTKLWAIFISFISIPVFFSSASLEISKSLAIVSSVSHFIHFVSSRIAELLIPLPVSSKDVSEILLMCLIRIFDIPLIASALDKLVQKQKV